MSDSANASRRTARFHTQSSLGAEATRPMLAVRSKERTRIASARRIMSAVFWGFFGVRKCRAMARDIATIKPAQLIVVGVVLTAILVFTLLLIVRLITRGL